MESTLLKELFKDISTEVDKHLQQCVSNVKYPTLLYDTSKITDLHEGKYRTKYVKRDLCPYIDIISNENLDYKLDAGLTEIIKKYSSELKDSRQRSLIQSHFGKFEKTTLDERLSKAETIVYGIATSASLVGAEIGLTYFINQTFMSHSSYPSCWPALPFAAMYAVVAEHWNHPLGKLFMAFYKHLTPYKHIALGTKYYEDDLEKKYFKKATTYAKSNFPSILKTIELNGKNSKKFKTSTG